MLNDSGMALRPTKSEESQPPSDSTGSSEAEDADNNIEDKSQIKSSIKKALDGVGTSSSFAARVSQEQRRLRKTLSRGLAKPENKTPRFLSYQLEHEYKDNQLKLESLKGLDKVKADYLKETCRQNNIGLNLSSME